MNLNQINENTNLTINVDKTYGIINSVKESFYHLFELFKEFVDEKVSKKTNTLDILMKNIKKSLKELDEILWNSKKYKKEYNYFQDIYLFTSYIFENNLLLLENIELIYHMMNLFSKIMQLKETTNGKEYESLLKEFKKKFYNYEQIFYDTIYIPSKEYDDKKLSEIRNILLSDDKQ